MRKRFKKTAELTDKPVDATGNLNPTDINTQPGTLSA